MSKSDVARRNFLIGAAAGAGAVVGAGVVVGTGLVREATVRDRGQDALPDAAAPDQPQPNDAPLGTFFNAADAATVAAFTERLMPSAPGKPGARDADVRNYIDLALSGAYADQQNFYRRGLDQLDEFCRATYNAPFVQLGDAQQDEVIAALETGEASGFAWPSAQAFFATVHTHTMEGMFADPIYGGNKNFAGWRLVGFPGAHPAFTPADLQSSEAFQGTVMIGLNARTKFS